MKTLRFFLALSLAGASLAARAEDEPVARHSPKLMLRTGGGIFTNTGDGQSVSASSIGGFNVGFFYFLTADLAAGLAYKAEFDLVRGALPFKGWDVAGRWYPWGQGTRSTKHIGKTTLEFHRSWSAYVIGQFSQRDYYLESDYDTVAPLEGSFGNVDFGIGCDFRISRQFEWNIEATQSVFAFASSDKNVRISSTLLNLGINYVW